MPYLLDLHLFLSKPIRPALPEEELVQDMDKVMREVDQTLANKEFLVLPKQTILEAEGEAGKAKTVRNSLNENVSELIWSADKYREWCKGDGHKDRDIQEIERQIAQKSLIQRGSHGDGNAEESTSISGDNNDRQWGKNGKFNGRNNSSRSVPNANLHSEIKDLDQVRKARQKKADQISHLKRKGSARGKKFGGKNGNRGKGRR
ncbi:unnamed protein product [Linum tenue]|uniref:Uncharacterized protein n=1 Tax=Linum tenue TaxID=586396 RepID=A0AAV0RWU3_9ROSI|nr:unnamed protein product [Linum tenue]